MQPTDTLRQATPQDAEVCAGVHVQAWKEAYVGLVPNAFLAALSVEHRWDQWRLWLEDADRSCWVAERGGRAVGFCLVGPSVHGSDPGFGEIQALYLLREAYGWGIADRLMGLGARDLQRRGYTGVTLRSMKHNPRARGFYDRLGGIVAGEGVHETQGLTIVDVEYCWPDISSLAML